MTIGEAIKINEFYRHRNNPSYGWAKALEIIPAKTRINKNTFIVVKVEWTVGKNDSIGFIKYFKASDLIKVKINK